jgi:tetratricopeptide (TPR) repeat protein
MALPAELTRATAQSLEYRSRVDAPPRSLPWVRLRALSAHVEPAWAGAEVTVICAFEGPEPPPPGALPLSHGTVVEVFGGAGAMWSLEETVRRQAPQALIGPVAQLLTRLPRPAPAEDERHYRSQTGRYGFGTLAGLALGRLRLSQGRLLQADNAFQAAASRSPRDGEPWRWLALTRLLAGNPDGALEASKHLLAMGARDTDGEYLHALSLYGTREFAEASERFARVLHSAANQAATRDLLACSLVQQWRIEEALRQLDALAAGADEGWRLMAQKCRICAGGYRAYQERLTRNRAFRWGERWQLALARIGAAIGILWWAAQLLWSRHRWVLLIIFPLVIAGLALYEGQGAQRRAQDHLADAQGKAPNMPCWYVSIVRRGVRQFPSRRSILETFERLLKADQQR